MVKFYCKFWACNLTLSSGLDNSEVLEPVVASTEQTEEPGEEEEAGSSAPTETEQLKQNTNPNKPQMQPQQFNAWLNLFSELDPIAQSKSGNVA